MYRFLTRPKWIAFHALMLGLVVTMVNLGFWQLRRLHERRDQNHTISQREAMSTTPLDSVLTTSLGRHGEAVRDAEWRPVSASGHYDAAHQLLIRNRSNASGQGGYHVVTPLVVDGRTDGAVLLVNRGWIDRSAETSVPAPASGTVTITGRVRVTQQRGLLGPHDPATGTLTQLARVDLDRIATQTSTPIYPAYVELLTQQPSTTGADPTLVPSPELDEGPHLSYAIQWFLFSSFVVIGWVIAVRRSAQAAAQPPDEGPPAGGEPGELSVTS